MASVRIYKPNLSRLQCQEPFKRFWVEINECCEIIETSARQNLVGIGKKALSKAISKCPTDHRN